MITQPTPEAMARAAECIRRGELVVFPTETVYGLGADATSGTAVAGIYAAKGRPAFNPLIIHFPDADAARAQVQFDARADMVASVFWPGPLTMVLPRCRDTSVCDLATAGLSTMAVRVPSHPVAQQLLKAVTLPVAAPSANVSGQLSPTTPQHVQSSLGDKPAMILAAGKSAVGLESTVLDLTTATPTILRAGAITAEDIARVLDVPVVYAAHQSDDPTAPKAPGMLLRHYAPRTKVRLNAVEVLPGEALLAFGSTRFMGVQGQGGVDTLPEDARRNLSPNGDLAEAAANLFAYLYELDRPEHTAIAVMPIPNEGIGVAINDRLQRAAAGAG